MAPGLEAGADIFSGDNSTLSLAPEHVLLMNVANGGVGNETGECRFVTHLIASSPGGLPKSPSA